MAVLEFWRRHARMLAAIGVGGLLLLGLAYSMTIERAPGIRVRWRDGLSATRQAELEWKYLLVNGRAPMADAPRSLAYDLQDTTRRNVRALVQDPDVADTNDIDRDGFQVWPTTRGGDSRMWLVHRVPVLRHAEGLWSLVALLSVMAVIGVFGIAAERRRQRELRGSSPESRADGDIFDRLPARFPAIALPGEGVPGYRLRRMVAALLVLLAIGVPILDTWAALFFGFAILAIVFGVGRPEKGRVVAAVLLVLVVIGVRALLPRADLAEGHNAFLVMGENEPLEQGLPPAVFERWKAQFDALYPPDEPYPPYSWRAQSAIPRTLFSESADASWRAPKYSRQVNVVGFHSLADFRGGFANDTQFNFWSGEIERSLLPFYVMYELTPASAGSELAWQGQVFWERADGAFDEIVHRDVAVRLISPDDAGRRVYAAFFPQSDPNLYFELRPSFTLRLAGWTECLLAAVGGLGVLVLMVRPRWPDYLRAASTVAISYLVVTGFTMLSGVPFLGKPYPPHGGGDDGLQHDAWGRMMALLAGQGDILEAFKGGEAVYWFTPGMRYVRMAEKLIFGDTNHLYALLLAVIPLMFFYLMRHFLGAWRAWVATAAFVCMPVGNLSFLQYMSNARIGYAEAAGMAMFLLGLLLLLRTQRAWGGHRRDFARVAVAGAALAASLFIRPNFGLAVVWLGAASAFASLRQRDPWAVVALGLGLSVALWMPFHNWFYGGEFFLVSRAGSTISVPLGPSDYMTAARDAVGGHLETHAVSVTSTQVKGWLSGPAHVELFRATLMPLAWAAHFVRLFALMVTCWLAARWARGRLADRTGLGVIAVAAICAQLPMLFVHMTFDRYAMLGWDLCLVVLIVWLIGPSAAAASAPQSAAA